MKRYEAIEKVGKAILEDGLVEALFLKGSIARGEDDDFSDVDMYAVVLPENEESFLVERLRYMETYMPLIYWSESNFVGPQIVGVFENALHFDLYTVTIDNIPQTDSIKILYDNKGILNTYKKKALAVSEADVALYFNEFTFSLLEFEIAFSRRDLIWSTRLASHLTGHISMVLSYTYNRDYSMLGSKRINKHLPTDLREEYVDILNYLTPKTMAIGINKLVEFTNKILNSLSDEIRENINIAFFLMMRERLSLLK